MEEASVDCDDCEIGNTDDAFNVTNICQPVQDSSSDDNENEPFKKHVCHLNELESDLAELTKERLGKMENFTLHLCHSSTNEHFDSVQSDDPCAIIEKCKNLDIKMCV